MQRSWNKYGEQSFCFEIIEQNLEMPYRAEREKYWIKYYDSYKNGLNQSEGGEKTSLVVYSKERNEKISKAIKGRKMPQTSGANNPRARRIICLNTKEEYETENSASEKLCVSVASVIRSCKEKITISKNSNLVLSYIEDYNTFSEERIKEIIKHAIDKRKEAKKANIKNRVVCLNTGEIFNSTKDAVKKYGGDYSYLLKCCKGLVQSSGKNEKGEKLYWKFEKDYNQ